MGKTAILAVKIIGDAKSATQAMGQTEQATGRLSKLGGTVKGGLVAATVAAAGLAVKIGVDGVRAAADLEQSVGAVDAVFKGSAGTMHQYANQAATTVGLAKNEYNELGVLIGSQLKNGGTATKDLASKTNELIKTGSDLSAMFGGTTKDAVAALSSALKGERDPIEKYGVSLNQAKIDAEAAALGYSKVGGSFDQQAQQAATLSLIMKQTGDAHGAFARESDTLAHKQQVLTAQWSNMKATIGSALLPVVSSLMTSLGQLANQVGPMLGPAMAALSAWLSRVWTAAQPLVTQITSALIPTLVNLWTSGIQPLIAQLQTSLTPVVQMLAQTVVPALVNAFRTVAPVVLELYQALAPFIQAVAGVLIPTLRILLPVVTTVWNGVVQIVRAAITVVTAIIRVFTAVLKGDWGAAWRSLGTLARAALSLVSAIVRAGMAVIGAVVRAGTALVKAAFSAAWSAIKAATSAAWSAIKSAVSTGISGVVTTVRGLPGKVKSALGNLGSLLVASGRALIAGFARGITAGIDKAVSAAKSVVGKVKRFFPSSPAKEGPFSGRGWTEYSGAATIEGFGAGIARRVSSTRSLIERSMRPLSEAMAVTPDARFPVGTASQRAAGPGSSARPIEINVHGFVGDEITLARELNRILGGYERLVTAS